MSRNIAQALPPLRGKTKERAVRVKENVNACVFIILLYF